MANPQVPHFQLALVSTISLQEWNDFRDEVMLYEQHIVPAIQALDPNAPIKPEPGAWTINPTNPTGRWNVVNQAMGWLYCLQAQHLGLQATANFAVAQAACHTPYAFPTISISNLITPDTPKRHPHYAIHMTTSINSESIISNTIGSIDFIAVASET